MSGIYYTRQHEWVRFMGRAAFVGLTGRSLQGDVVYIELPDIGRHVSKGEPCAKVESLKGLTTICSPAAGVVSAVNDAVFDDPDEVAKRPLSTWLFKVDCEGEAEPEGLLTEAEYQKI